MYNYVHTSYKKIIKKDIPWHSTRKETKRRHGKYKRLTTEYGFSLCLQTVFHDDNGD